MKYAFATWCVDRMPDPNELHISCGPDDDNQWDGFFFGEPRSKLVVRPFGDGFWVTLMVPARNLTRYKDYWLSPCTIEQDGKEIEAEKFGIKEE